jgi:DNA-binding IclR family transcriptional regulator
MTDQLSRYRGDHGRRSYYVKSVARAAAILKAFEESETLSLAQLAETVDLPKPTVLRLASTLEQFGLLERRIDGFYCLGLRFVSIAHRVLSRGFPQAARPFMHELWRVFGHTVNLAVLVEGEMLFVDVLESRHNVRVVSPVGAREPVHATALGKAVAAQLDPAACDQIFLNNPLDALTPQTITSRARLDEELLLTRQRGFATDLGECRVEGHCVAAPVFDRGGICGSIGMSATSTALPLEAFSIAGAAVREAATSISEVLGVGHGYDDFVTGESFAAIEGRR